MDKPVKTAVITAAFGIIGIYLGAALNMEGYLGIVFAVAAAAGCIVDAMNNGK